eukprot:5454458-Prymnesium_polylepis.1
MHVRIASDASYTSEASPQAQLTRRCALARNSWTAEECEKHIVEPNTAPPLSCVLSLLDLGWREA